MRNIVETKGRTYEEAVESALAKLGIPRERAKVMLVQSRDTDRRTPGPEEYLVRVWEMEPGEGPEPIPGADVLNVPPPPRVMTEKTGPTFDEAVQAALKELGITEEEADVQMIQRQDTNPLKAGPEKVTVRVWRRRPADPAPNPARTGAEDIHSVRAAAHLPGDEELRFEEGPVTGSDTEDTP